MINDYTDEEDYDDDTDLDYVHGFLTSILCAPNLIPLNKWFGSLYGDENGETEFSSEEDSELITTNTLDLYNDIAMSLIDKTFEPYYPELSDAKDPKTAINWCAGFVVAQGLWDSSYSNDEKILELTLIVSEILSLETNQDQNLAINLDLLRENILDLSEYCRNITIGKISRSKTGRNDLCTCNSGKKYKHCCGKAK